MSVPYLNMKTSTTPPLASNRLRIVVLGYVVRGPMGGMVTSNLQYLMGLRQLGHDVYFVEDSDDYESCYNPVTQTLDADPTYGLEFATDTFERIGMGDRWAYYDAHTSRWRGPSADRIVSVCADADLVLNLCGVNPLRPWLEQAPARVFIDEDPTFTQIKHLTRPGARYLVDQHTRHFSFAENIGQSDCSIPDDGIHWRPTRQPIVLDDWPVVPGPSDGRFTTIMSWSSYPAQQYKGRRYGTKCDAFAAYADLPRKTKASLEMAVAAVPLDVARHLSASGWCLTDPTPVSHRPWTYREYIQASKAEFSIAKHGYAVSRSGWFSERSACYLASGRPVVVQDTGFTRWLPTGEGVIAFNTPEEAVAGIEEIERRYALHCRAARAIAEEYFDARKILRRLLEEALNAAAFATQGSRVT